MNSMLQFLSENFVAILSIFGIGGGTGALGVFYGHKQAQADISKSVQDVYQEMLDDLKNDRNELRKEIESLRGDLIELRRLIPMLCKKKDCMEREHYEITEHNDASISIQ